MTFTQNPFALLDDEAAAAVVAPVAVKKAPAVVTKQASSVATASGNKAPRGSENSRRGGFRGGAVGGASEATAEDPARPIKENSHARNAARMPRRGQLKRGGLHGGNGRELDRHSALARDSDKKVEKGWGQSATTEEDARDETGFVADVDGVVSPVDANGDAVESEPPVKTLDDYLAEKAAAKKPSLALPVQRQANEGADASKWKNTVAIQRPPVEEEMFFKPTAAGKKDKAVAAQQQKSTKSNKTVAIEVKFMDEPAPRFERSERGGSRGGARGGASRGGASRGGASRGGASRGQGSTRGGPTPNVSDKSAFPTLAAK